MPLLTAGSSAATELRELLANEPPQPALGMVPGIYSWWAGSASPSPAWLREEAAERAAYAR